MILKRLSALGILVALAAPAMATLPQQGFGAATCPGSCDATVRTIAPGAGQVLTVVAEVVPQEAPGGRSQKKADACCETGRTLVLKATPGAVVVPTALPQEVPAGKAKKGDACGACCCDGEAKVVLKSPVATIFATEAPQEAPGRKDAKKPSRAIVLRRKAPGREVIILGDGDDGPFEHREIEIEELGEGDAPMPRRRILQKRPMAGVGDVLIKKIVEESMEEVEEELEELFEDLEEEIGEHLEKAFGGKAAHAPEHPEFITIVGPDGAGGRVLQWHGQQAPHISPPMPPHGVHPPMPPHGVHPPLHPHGMHPPADPRTGLHLGHAVAPDQRGKNHAIELYVDGKLVYASGKAAARGHGKAQPKRKPGLRGPDDEAIKKKLQKELRKKLEDQKKARAEKEKAKARKHEAETRAASRARALKQAGRERAEVRRRALEKRRAQREERRERLEKGRAEREARRAEARGAGAPDRPFLGVRGKARDRAEDGDREELEALRRELRELGERVRKLQRELGRAGGAR